MRQTVGTGSGPWRRRVAVALSVAYTIGLLVAWVVLRFAGERWWLPLVGLYAPPIGFFFPAPFVLAVTWRWAGRRWFASQFLAALLALYGLLGPSLGLGRDRHAVADPRAIRLVSYNIQLGQRGMPGILAQVAQFQSNLVLLQEAHQGLAAGLREAFVGWHVDSRDQFFIASRFPILEVREPARLLYKVDKAGSTQERAGGAHFMAYTLDSDLGPIDVFSVHTTSPREGLDEMRGSGFLHELRQGHILLGRNSDTLLFNAYRRRRQVEAVAAAARASKHPVIIAGDFNLPGLSRVAHDSLGDFDEAFVEAGWGFGYTFPSKLPFLRIDRIFTGHGLRAVDFRQGDTLASDHLCVYAVITADGLSLVGRGDAPPRESHDSGP